MSEQSEDPAERLTPTAAFALLGDPTRLGVLRTLWEADGPLSFSELRDRGGVSDSGRFNYHLGKLRGQFVRRTDDGYELRQAGLEVVRAVLAGIINEAPVREPTRIGASCPDCDGDLVVSYDGHGAVTCDDCEAVWMYNEFPPAGLAGRDAPALARALDRWTRHRTLLAMDGVCPNCATETRCAVEPTARGHFVDWRCPHCEHVSRAPLWAVVLEHPTVTSFLHDHGVDADQPFWELATLPVRTEPEEGSYTLQFALDDGSLDVALDNTLQVVSTTHRG